MKIIGLFSLKRLCVVLIWTLAVSVGSLESGRAFAQPAPAEIVELARALKNSPDLIYEYVHNNIETLPQYGSSKGALGALLDGKGTAFDQAELMVVLLQQAGFNASYQIGAIELSASQLTNWLGTDNRCTSLDATLGSGGFPTTFLPSSCTSAATGAQIGWAWVAVSIGGTNFVFDPATKTYNRSTGLASISSVLGYTKSGFLSAVAATGTATKLTGLNRTNARDTLAAYANNLVQYTRANNPAAATSDIIGGKTITKLPLGTQLRQTSLSYAVAGSVQSQPTIPGGYRLLLTLQFGSNDPSGAFTQLSSPITFNSSDIYGRRIVVSFNATLAPVLLLDGVVQMTGSGAVPSNRQLTIRTSIAHPYPSSFSNIVNSDQIRVTPPSIAGTGLIYLIGTGWGQVGRGMIEKHRKLLQQNTAQNPGNPSAEPVLGESLAMLGYTWLAEISQQQQLVDQLALTTTIFQHAVGVVGMKAVGSSVGPFVDLPLNGVSIIQRVERPVQTTFNTTPIEAAAFFCEAIFLSIAESGTLEQTQPGATAASTVKLVDTTIQSGGAIFDINNSAVAGDNCSFYDSNIRPSLLNYSPGDLARIDRLVGRLAPGACLSPALRVIAPANGSITVDQFTGAGYFQITQDGTAVGSIISGGLSGGFSGSPVPIPEFVPNTSFSATVEALQSYAATLPGVVSGNAGGFAGITQISNEPINLVTGDYLLSASDLTIGSQSMPLGLSIQRYYDSGTRLQKRSFGLGWTHNFAVFARKDSDPFEGMGINSPINGAVAIAATLVTLDILNDGVTTAKPLDRVVIGAVIQRWLMDQITTNVAIVSQPGLGESFTKLADGSYNPPPGSAATLTIANGVFTYIAKDRRTLSFDNSGNLSTLAEPSGATIKLNYSGTPTLLTSVANNLGRTLTFAYSSGLLTGITDDSGRNVSYTYDASGNLTSFTDAMKNTTNYAYDVPGRLTQIFYPSSPTTPAVTNAYDSLGRVRTQADANNNLWQYFLAGTRSEEVNPLGMQHVIYISPRGKTLTEIQDLNGLNQVTTNIYDPLDRLISTIAPEGNSINYAYDSKSNVLTTTAIPKPGSPLSSLVTAYSYDPVFNKPVSTTDPRGLVKAMAYDATTGNLISVVTDAGVAPHFNATMRFTYNNVGQVLTSTDPLGTVTLYNYDSFGNRISIRRDAGTGRLNQLTSSSYNSQGDVVSVIDPKGSLTSNTYDAARRPVTTIAPNGVVAAFRYDPDGRLLSTQQSANGAILRTTSATYTLTGKRATATDANGNVTKASYDALDRLASETDAMGRVASYSYDALSRQTKGFNAAIQSLPLFQKGYTPNGALANLTDANNNTTSFTYDGFDRLASTVYPLGSTEAFNYDANSNVLTRKTRAGDTINFVYDTLNRLSTKTPPSPSPVVSYNYDIASRLIGANDTSAAVAAAALPVPNTTYTTSTAYDVLNRPISVVWDPAPIAAIPAASSVTFSHLYNKANQRTGQMVSDNAWLEYPAAAPSTVSYTPNSLSQYAVVGAVTPSYDGNGNLTGDGTFTYGYDAESRLVSASGTGVTASYAYDAQGRRKSKTVNGAVTLFVTDADNREVLEYDGANGAPQRWYAYGLGSNNVLNQMNVAAAARTTFIPDIQGSIIATLDSGTGAFNKAGYLPYGESASTGGTFRYTGQRIDAETGGLYYYRARTYKPAWGRFMQVDPIGYQGGINLYAYVNNDPLNNLDPFGLDCISGGGTTTCGTSAYKVNFPTPNGWRDFTSSSTNYHFYSTPANVGSANSTAVQQWVTNNPTPGSPGPATPQGTLNDATPVLGGISPINISPVLSYTTTNQSNGSPVVLNVTLPGHPLFPGVVVREVDQSSSGTVINNFGEGTSALQSPDTLGGRELGPSINGVWTGQVPPRK